MDTWISDTSDSNDMKLKKQFAPDDDSLDPGLQQDFFNHLDLSDYTFSICFYQLCLYFPKSIVDGIPTQRQVKWEKSETYNYEIEETSISCKWQWKWKWKVKVDESVGSSNFDFRCLKFGFYLLNQFRFHSYKFSYTWLKSDENISEGNIFFYSLFIFNVRYLQQLYYISYNKLIQIDVVLPSFV